MQYTKNGFTCSFTGEEKRVVFFSVPYEEGWRATVNGKPADILRANLGFMAVVCDAGENDIEFTFTTPGLHTGFLIAGISGIAVPIYLGYEHFVIRKRRNVENLRRMAAIAQKSLD